MSEDEESSRSAGPSYWPAVALIVTLLGAAIALAFAGWEPNAIIGFLSGLAGVGGTLVALFKVNQKQTETLQRIDRQVNGELDRRIQKGAEQAAQTVLNRVLGPPSNGSNRRR